jgi:hypothetical protein
MVWYLIAWHVLYVYFAWPYGFVWGNVWAIIPCGAITLATAWFARHKIGRNLVRWLHKHYVAHLAELERTKDDVEPEQPA